MELLGKMSVISFTMQFIVCHVDSLCPFDCCIIFCVILCVFLFFFGLGLLLVHCFHEGVALLSFKAMNYVLYIGGIFLCYRFTPLRKLSQIKPVKKKLAYLEEHYPFYRKSKAAFLRGADKMADSKFFKWIPYKLGINSKRFTMALAENAFLYKVTIPITFPLQFWAIVHYYKKRSKHFTAEEIFQGSTHDAFHVADGELVKKPDLKNFGANVVGKKM